ncbi:uncharacterized protein [Eleutherodactylus coqui]|uniref:uncharacterized protein n=1 Tax=Eleutherodactylus coqui TaxID=57060 RepID=UPI0034637DC0
MERGSREQELRRQHPTERHQTLPSGTSTPIGSSTITTTAQLGWVPNLRPTFNLQVESRPEIWDPAELGYSDRDIKADAWNAVCTEMYPDWDSATAATQSEILKDIKNRWRSVRDRYKKHEKDCEKSGMSPSKKKCPNQEILHFLRTSRALRPSSGNITAAAPTVETATADTEGQEEESRDDDITEGTPTLEDSQRSTPDLSRTSVTPEVVEQNVSRSSSAGPSSRACSSREVSSERTSRSVAAHPRRKNKADAANEALTLLRRVDTEDQWDTMGATIASRIRELRPERQWAIAPVIYYALELFASERPIADSCTLISAMKNTGFAVPQSNRMLPTPQSFPDQPGRVPRTTGYPMHHVSQDTGYGDTVSGGSPSPSQQSFLSMMSSPVHQTSQHTTTVLYTPPSGSQSSTGDGSFINYTTLQ